MERDQHNIVSEQVRLLHLEFLPERRERVNCAIDEGEVLPGQTMECTAPQRLYEHVDGCFDSTSRIHEMDE